METPDPSRPTPSAFDRVQSRPEPADETPFAWKTLALVALVALGVAGAYAWLWDDDVAGNENLLVHLIESSADFRADVGTTSPADAEAFIYDQLGWAVSPPDLPGLALVGVEVASIGAVDTGTTNGTTSEVIVPAYRYEGTSGETAYLYAYDYIVLDRVRGAFDLPEATYAVLGEPTPVDTRRLDDAYLVTWRERAMIFTAVTTSESVFERIGQAVAS